MRTIGLIDGQNLYHLAKIAWAPVPVPGSSPYSWPSYGVRTRCNGVLWSQVDFRI